MKQGRTETSQSLGRLGVSVPHELRISVSSMLIFLLVASLPRYCAMMMDHSGPHTLCI